MFHVVLYEPEIPANTGNVGRLCLAAGCTLHLVGQPGFHLDDRSVRRAGLDYWEHVRLVRHVDMREFEAGQPAERIFCFSAHAERPYTRAEFEPGDALVFGSESRGLPPEVLARHADRTFTIPMFSGRVRSLNLATAVGIVVYEALRQVDARAERADPPAGWEPIRKGGLFALAQDGDSPVMEAVASLPTLDDLCRHVRAVLCEHDQLDPDQTPLLQSVMTRSNRPCGLFFQVQGPRRVKTYAVWAGEENRILFYDSHGQRFAQTRLSEGPDPHKLKKG